MTFLAFVESYESNKVEQYSAEVCWSLRPAGFVFNTRTSEPSADYFFFLSLYSRFITPTISQG